MHGIVAASRQFPGHLGASVLDVRGSREYHIRMAGLPLPLRALMFPLVVLTLMTFVVMPVLTRVMRRWLGPRQDAEPPQGELSQGAEPAIGRRS